MDSKYNPKEIEAKWYQYWLDNKLFHSEPDGREPFTIVIPPPNVTGVLHMGHVLNETIQDVLVRRARLEGKNACWVPGTDHASIATEAKVIKRLKEQGINKSDLTREQFLKHAWDWTDEHGGIILKQLRTLGCSCDWDRTSFTMDEVRSKAVIKVFCDLYKKGLIYRGLRMVNWDPERQTALSDEEVIYHDEHSHLFYLKYEVVEQPGKYCIVATTRPETIMGDVCVCINPKEEKNQWLKGLHVRVPLVGREVPIIEDRYVEIGFGTGCLKVTPAHDVNDYMLGQKYNLPIYDTFTADAHLSLSCLEKEVYERVKQYDGLDRFDCRKQIVEDLKAAGLVDHIEDYDNKVGYSERTNVPIEPRLSLQWFIKMQHFADIALPPVMNDEIVFYPAKYKNTYRNWLEGIKDWCISRQLWWGHRIPAYYIKEILDQTGLEDYPNDLIIVAPSLEEAKNQLSTLNLPTTFHTACRSFEACRDKNFQLSTLNLIQDEGALDTWFSSWLWPISLFLKDGSEIDNRALCIDNSELQYYYPTADLVTGPDIIFFWVARMIMAGYEYMGKMPFKHVYFTGIVRDKLGRKMSKSLGNSPDPLDLINTYGADGVRMGILLSAPAGNDILYDDALCEQGRNFCNKIWNCFRMVKGLEVKDMPQPATSRLAVDWFRSKLNAAAIEIDDLMKKYRLSEALMAIYKLYTDEFSGWYLEMIKPAYQQPIDRTTYEVTLQYFDQMLRLLHPFMPFITEELWQDLAERKPGESIMFAQIQLDTKVDDQLLDMIEFTKEVVAGVRNVRAMKNIPPKERLTLISPVALSDLVGKLGICDVVSPSGETRREGASSSFIVGTSEFCVPLDNFINKDEEIKKLEADLAHQEGFLKGVMAKLGNERFVANAKPEVVELERKKKADAEQRITTLRQAISALKCFLIGALCLGQVFWTTLNAAQKPSSFEEKKPLKIVFDNDVHGSIDRYEYLAGFRNALVEAGYPVLTVSVGDYLQGSAYASVSKGQFCVDMMNAVGYDVVTIGNHDVDYGVQRLMTMREALGKTAMVCANLYDVNNKPCLPAYTMANVGGYRVAFVGVVTTATEQLQANIVFDRDGNRQCSFSKDSLVQLVQQAIDEVRLGNPDWVILLTHMGEEPLNDHMASWQLMDKLKGVDVMIDGHSHSVINTVIYPQTQENPVPVAQTGYGLKNVGCLTLEKDAVPQVKLYAYQNLPQSEAVHAKYQNVENEMQPIMGQIVGYTAFDLLQSFAGKRLVRNQETNLGDLVADAYRTELGTDIGWVNGGGIRHGIEMGDINYGQMLSVSPFNNFMCIAQAKGQMIADALEESYHNCPTDLGAFAQISGLRCTIDTTISNGLSWNEQGRMVVNGKRRVSNIEVLKDGQWRPMDMDEVLTIGSTNYVLFEGELQGLKKALLIKDKVMTDTECLQKYVTNTLEGVIPDQYSKPQGRIIIR